MQLMTTTGTFTARRTEELNLEDLSMNECGTSEFRQRVSAIIALAVGMIFCAPSAKGIEFTTPANVRMNGNTSQPGLAGVLDFGTDVPTSVGIRVQGPGESWLVNSSAMSTSHSFPLLGFLPNTKYDMWLTLTDESGASQTFSGDNLKIQTAPLPDDFPTLTLLKSDPSRMEPGYTLLPAEPRGNGRGAGENSSPYAIAADESGNVRWYYPGSWGIIRRQDDGDLIYGGNIMREMDFVGNVKNAWHTQSRNIGGDSVEIQIDRVHHDTYPMPNGNFLTIGYENRMIENFPTSETDLSQTGTVDVRDTPVFEFAPDGSVVNEYSFLDMLDPTRIGYDTLGRRDETTPWAWGNGVIYDEKDDAVITSLRFQDAVVKFSRETGDLIWILGNHDNWGEEFQEYLLEPQGEEFEWQYHQHAPFLLPNGNILIHDNGNHRAMPPEPGMSSPDSYTRAVEYSIDEENMQITQVWEFGKEADEVIYASAFGDADWMPETDNVLITYGWPQYIDGETQTNRKGRIREVTRDGEVVFDIDVDYPQDDVKSASVYRSDRIEALYPPEYQMTHLTPGDIDGNGTVEFSDFLVVSENFGQEGGYLDGDIDGNGRIEFADFLVLSTNFGQTDPASVATPEPSAAFLLLFGLLAVSRRRIR